MHVRFEWHAEKAARNLEKHGVSFELAARVFTDPFMLLDQDRVDDGEQRWQALGQVDDAVLLLVVHTVREEEEDSAREVIRIISARKAGKEERNRYGREAGAV